MAFGAMTAHRAIKGDRVASHSAQGAVLKLVPLGTWSKASTLRLAFCSMCSFSGSIRSDTPSDGSQTKRPLGLTTTAMLHNAHRASGSLKRSKMLRTPSVKTDAHQRRHDVSILLRRTYASHRLRSHTR